jgi:hypothetical protein
MSSKLIAIKIHRRVVASAVFSGRTLEHLDTLHLCNEPDAVTDTVARFFAWSVENFKPEAAAIGFSRAAQGERVKTLLEMAEGMFAASGMPLWKIDDKTLLESFAVPKLKNKDQLKPIVRSLWPHLGNHQLPAFEAAALGLHVQVERLLSHH